MVCRCATVVSTVRRPPLSCGHLLAPARKQHANGRACCGYIAQRSAGSGTACTLATVRSVSCRGQDRSGRPTCWCQHLLGNNARAALRVASGKKKLSFRNRPLYAGLLARDKGGHGLQSVLRRGPDGSQQPWKTWLDQWGLAVASWSADWLAGWSMAAWTADRSTGQSAVSWSAAWSTRSVIFLRHLWR